jgi:WhiB family redox-sensing transcriptional regulator
MFFPERSQVEAAKAKAICANCPVKQQCLDEAIRNCERFGIWGGMDQEERRKEARRRRRKQI